LNGLRTSSSEWGDGQEDTRVLFKSREGGRSKKDPSSYESRGKERQGPEEFAGQYNADDRLLFVLSIRLQAALGGLQDELKRPKKGNPGDPDVQSKSRFPPAEYTVGAWRRKNGKPRVRKGVKKRRDITDQSVVPRKRKASGRIPASRPETTD